MAVAVFKSNKKVFSTGPLDVLLLDAVNGLHGIASTMYGDELAWFEMDGMHVHCFFGPRDVVVVSFGRDEERRLEDVYEAYCVCAVFGDMELMDVLLGRLC